jgi:hypothetical protein
MTEGKLMAMLTESHRQQKSIRFTSAGWPPLIGRRADFLHFENDLV